MKLWLVGKQTGLQMTGGHQWQAYFAVAEDEVEAVALADSYGGRGWWADHPDPPTVVLVAETIILAPNLPQVFCFDSLNEGDFFPRGVPSKVTLAR